MMMISGGTIRRKTTGLGRVQNEGNGGDQLIYSKSLHPTICNLDKRNLSS